MPLSTVLGAQSLIKPGVCTTATRPASPYTGQMIYDTTVSQALVWNGTAWAVVGATAGGATLISRTTPTAAASLTFDSVFSSTYKTYLIVVEQAKSTTAGSYMSFNLRYGSTTNTGGNWFGGIYGNAYNNNAYEGTTTSSGTSFRCNSGLNNSNGSTIQLTVSGVGVASQVPGVICASAEVQDGKARSGSATLQDSSQTYTGFVLTSSAGNLSATVAVYGLATA